MLHLINHINKNDITISIASTTIKRHNHTTKHVYGLCFLFFLILYTLKKNKMYPKIPCNFQSGGPKVLRTRNKNKSDLKITKNMNFRLKGSCF